MEERLVKPVVGTLSASESLIRLQLRGAAWVFSPIGTYGLCWHNFLRGCPQNERAPETNSSHAPKPHWCRDLCLFCANGQLPVPLQLALTLCVSSTSAEAKVSWLPERFHTHLRTVLLKKYFILFCKTTKCIPMHTYTSLRQPKPGWQCKLVSHQRSHKILSKDKYLGTTKGSY